MAAAVTSVTLTEQTVFGNKRVSFVTIVPSASYVAGGDTFTPAQCGLDVIDYVVFRGPAVLTAGGTTAAVPGISLLSTASSLLLQLFGTGSSSTTALIELANGDYHTYSVRAMVIGA